MVGKICFITSLFTYSITQKVNETFSVYYIIEFVSHRFVNSMFTTSNNIDFQINTVACVLHVKYNRAPRYTLGSLVKYRYLHALTTGFS